MLRLILSLSVLLLYFHTPTAFGGALEQLGTYKDYAFSFWLALLLTPNVIAWFE